jgi:hypothetical protein
MNSLWSRALQVMENDWYVPLCLILAFWGTLTYIIPEVRFTLSLPMLVLGWTGFLLLGFAALSDLVIRLYRRRTNVSERSRTGTG